MEIVKYEGFDRYYSEKYFKKVKGIERNSYINVGVLFTSKRFKTEFLPLLESGDLKIVYGYRNVSLTNFIENTSFYCRSCWLERTKDNKVLDMERSVPDSVYIPFFKFDKDNFNEYLELVEKDDSGCLNRPLIKYEKELLDLLVKENLDISPFDIARVELTLEKDRVTVEDIGYKGIEIHSSDEESKRFGLNRMEYMQYSSMITPEANNNR